MADMNKTATVTSKKSSKNGFQESLIFVDLETTGLDPSKDRICQIGMILPNGKEVEYLINPEIPIPEEASRLHGITDEMVEDAPKFKDLSKLIIEALEASEIFVAYNSSFDFSFLQYELYRDSKYELRESNFVFIDPYRVFKKMFPHSLQNAYRFYLGEEMQDAHSAMADIIATKKILEKQKELYSDFFAQNPKEIEKQSLGKYKTQGRWFDLREDAIYFKQGKHKGEKFSKETHLDYLNWIASLEDLTLSERFLISDLLRKGFLT
jgi:DNA polymerase III subunit epsilon